MDSVFIIAECGSCWRFFKAHPDSGKCGDEQLENAYRMIIAAKECGADAVKFQWTSDYKLMMARRGASLSEEEAYTFVQYPREWLSLFKAKCDAVGIEFMCTVFLPQDVAVIAPLVKRFKVSAYEATYEDLYRAIPFGNEVIVSRAKEVVPPSWIYSDYQINQLHCVSKYPTPLDEISLSRIRSNPRQLTITSGLVGLSDHTAHVLTGAVAVGAGARVIEFHCRLHDTPRDNPDYGHSLVIDYRDIEYTPNGVFYVQNVRTASRML